jgi:exodeoxyribonuclease-5
MDLAPEQEIAIRKAKRWLSGPEQVFRLYGYAGTGKTTIAKMIGDLAGNTLYGALTGKATSVLKLKGCPTAMTLHSMIYIPKGEYINKRARQMMPIFALKEENFLTTADLLVVDEASMIDEVIGSDLSRFAKKNPRTWRPCSTSSGNGQVFFYGW